MKCPNCGRPYEENETICPSCGQPLSNARYTPVDSHPSRRKKSNQEIPESGSPDGVTHKSKKKGRRLLLVLLILIILAAAGAGGYFY